MTNFILATDFGPALISGLVSLGAAFVAVTIGVYFRRVSRVTVGKIEVLSERVSGFDRSRSGVVVCDYVDVGTLATLATQYGVQRAPDEVEKTNAAKSELRGQFSLGGSSVGAANENATTERALYRAKNDPNLLTEEVLEALQRNASIRSDLGALPTVGIDELKQIAQGGGTIDAEKLYGQLVATAKAREFQRLANSEEFILIDAEWDVEMRGGDLAIRLAQLGHPPATSDMPSGVDLISLILNEPPEQVGQALWSAQGRNRIRVGTRIRASVLGRAGPFDPSSDTLTLLPIVVFARLGRREDSSSWGTAGSSDWTASSWESD